MLGYKTEQGDFKKYGERNACFFGKDLIQYFSDVQGNSPKYKYDENYNISESEFDFMKDTFTINAKNQQGSDDSSNYAPPNDDNSNDNNTGSKNQTSGGTQS